MKQQTLKNKTMNKTIFNNYNDVENALLNELATETEDVDIDALIEEIRENDLVDDDDKIIINEGEFEISVDVYKNGRWYNNLVLWEFG